MNLFGFNIKVAREEQGLTTLFPRGEAKDVTALASVDSRGGWFPVIRESYPGAWQNNVEINLENVMTFAAVYACVTVPARDIAKLRIKLVQQAPGPDGLWQEVESPSFSPVLRKPNHFQTRIQFIEQWAQCVRMHGNAYILKHRDSRQIVVGMYVLDPSRCRPLVAPNGEVFYELKTDHLSGVRAVNRDSVYVPAREIIHDRINTLYHPLVGISPISACGLSAVMGLRIQNNSTIFFGNGAKPSGVLTAPGHIAQDTADRMKAYWQDEFSGDNSGNVAILGDGLHYEQMSMSAVDAQLIEQLRWPAENVCTAFNIKPYRIGIGPMPTHNNAEILGQEYYSETLQNPIEAIELLLDEGLGLTENGLRYGVEFEIEGLWRMDTKSRMEAAEKALRSGLTVNEVRRRYHDAQPVPGGDTIYLQQQNYSLEALSKRDESDDPFGRKQLPPAQDDSSEDDEPEPEAIEGETVEADKFAAVLLKKASAIAKRNSLVE